MRSIHGEESSPLGGHGSSAHEEKILVSVRLRPLNEKEISKNDISEWECDNNTTIVSKTSKQERPTSPTAYSFDRVFDENSSTRQVYEEGARQVALSVIQGINVSIFAYGQTSSGKTYTMSGITEHTLSDLYNHVTKHATREFVLKFSAMEIYNELVRDLLTPESTALRLLDDPERGTVVEKLTEVTLRDWDHLEELLSVCQAQRKVGETSLNETSSRSHQILRLTVESSPRKYSTSPDSGVLTATVNFVDLAGSERASQTMSVNSRLKEGCHINRSLLTLGTVIRKLSKGRNGHVPYRDSKLTRILQNSLGGNARTAIICTLSPAHSHIEQSRNTLLFANCAKQVTNTAQVNVVMSEKALVKLLQKELARLNKLLKNVGSLSSGSCESLSALQEKERLIEKMNNEIRELTQQRDHANSRLQNFHRVGGQSGRSLSWADSSSLSPSSHGLGMWPDCYSPSEVSETTDPFRSESTSITSDRVSDRYEETIGPNKIEDMEGEEQFFTGTMTPSKVIDKYFGPDPYLGWEKSSHTSNENIQDILKDVRCVEVEVDKGSFKYEQVTSHQSLHHQELRSDDNNETSRMDAQDMMNNSSNCLDDISHNKEEGSPCSSDIDNISDSCISNDDIIRNETCGAIITVGSSEVTKDCSNVIQTGLEEETPEKFVEANNLKASDELNHDSEKHEDEISSDEKVDQQKNNLKVFDELNYNNEKHEDEAEISSDDKVDQQKDNLKVFDELNHDNEKLEDREDKTEISTEENVDHHPYTMKVCDELNHENEEFEGREYITETYIEENVDRQHDYSTTFKEDYDLKCRYQFGDHSIDTIEDKKLECEKQVLDHSTTDENLECQNQLEDVREDEIPECKNLTVECEDCLVDNSTSVVVSSIDDDNIQHETEDNHVLEIEPTSEIVDDSQLSSSNWSKEFENQRREIIELWNACNVPLLHRTYFFLLFKGEPSDSIYMQVEQRRLSYLKATLSRTIETSSLKALRRERENLRRQMLKKFSAKERESLYEDWGVELRSKRRVLQLCSLLWTDTKDLEHIKKSAALVGELVGLVEPNDAPKEIFGLCLPQSTSFRSQCWISLSSLL